MLDEAASAQDASVAPAVEPGADAGAMGGGASRTTRSARALAVAAARLGRLARTAGSRTGSTR
jgi:hypothetical protein